MSRRIAVVGGGIMGLAAAASLAEAGANVTLYEASSAVSGPDGGSHGKARIIRLTYGAAEYCRLAREAFSAWDRVGAEEGAALYHRVGGLDIALSGGAAFADYRAAMDAACVSYQELGAREVAARFPQIALPAGAVALHQDATAVLHADLCAAALARRAVAAGGALRTNCRVGRIEAAPDGVTLATEAGPIVADQVVIAAGSAAQAFAEQCGTALALDNSPERVSYFRAKDPLAHSAERMPILIFHLGGGVLSSVFPLLRDTPVKAMVENNGRATGTPAEIDALKCRELTELTLPWLPLLEPTPAATERCHYVLTRDGDFVIDRLPSASNVILCSACSGHGFKFAPVIGNMIRDLALTDEAAHPRFAIDLARRPGLAP